MLVFHWMEIDLEIGTGYYKFSYSRPIVGNIKTLTIKRNFLGELDLLRKGWQKDIAMEIDRRFPN